jgi:hypothetical protein
MKESIVCFFTYNSDVPQVSPIPRDKTGRSFNNMLTARALCPRSYIYSFDNESGYLYAVCSPKSRLMTVTSFIERITNGNVKVTSGQFPNFLYDEGEAEELTEENPTFWDVERGLLRSLLCVWVLSHLVFIYCEHD